MGKRGVVRVGLIMVAAGLLACTGCSSVFMQNRTNDLLDMFDGGITTSDRPEFALYLGFFNFLTVGYSGFDGTLHGICGRETGAFPARHHAVGLVLWGREEIGYNEAADPEKPEQPDSYAVGPLGLAFGPRPPFRQTLNCPKLFHFGWVGIALNCHFPEFADFFLGWLGLDIFNDDTAGRTPAPKKAEKPPVTK